MIGGPSVVVNLDVWTGSHHGGIPIKSGSTMIEANKRGWC
jgi:hypothetical protein